MLYACGSNGNGQLGVGHGDDLSEWTEVPVHFSGPVEIVGGGNHTVVLEYSTGRCWVTKDAIFTLLPHPKDKKWRKIGAGWSFTVLVDELDQVWTLGSGNHGELGSKSVCHAESVTNLEFLLNPGETIISVSSGMRHSAILASSGRVYAWGASRRGQCGVISKSVDTPTLIDLSITEKVVSVSCGRDFTVLVTENSILHVLGNDRRFDLSNDPITSSHILTGWSNFISENTLYGSTIHNGITLPTKPLISEVAEFQKAMGSEHLIWASQDTVYTSGWGEHGNCPPPSKFVGNIAVFGGCATSFVYST